MFEQLLDQAKSAQARYLQHSDPTGLDESIAAWERILQHPDFATVDADFRLTVLDGSAGTYWYRYGVSGEVADLNRALLGMQEVVKLIPEDSPDLPMYLNNLGICFLERYGCKGNLSDLQESIKASKRAVQLTPAGSPDLPMYLNNLGNSLRSTGDQYDLEKAIEAYQQAVQLTPEDSPELPSRLNNLGIGLTDRYARMRKLSDLKKGMAAYQRAVQLTRTGSPYLPNILNNLGTGFQDRYYSTDDLSDLQEAIAAFQQAVQLTPAGSPELPKYLNNQGSGFQDRHARTGDLTDLQAGKEAYQRATQRGLEVALEWSLKSARIWLRWAFQRQALKEITQAYSYADEAIQRLLKSQLLRAHKESWLKEMQGLASQAAYAFTKLNQLKDAVVTLERGIARLLSETIQRDRTNLEQLKTTGHIDLYNCYLEIVERYHWAQLQQDVNALKTAQADLDKTIEDIRQVPSYENFLMPVEFDLIQKAAQETPLVYILTTSAGGLALIVHQQTIIPVELPEFKDEVLGKNRSGYFTAYNHRQQNRQAWHQAIDDMGQWLWQVLWQPLCKVLLPNQQRLTLIPVGWLNLLPLHAAWTVDPTGKRYYALDELTIAYAPNAVSLQQARDLATHILSDKLLAIDEPKPLKAAHLPNSSVEVNAIAQHFTPTQSQILSKEAATQEAVKRFLTPSYNVLHFSCHGEANIENPLETGLLMANYDKLTVQHFLDAKLQARLATLSACETGIIGTKNIEEVVGLPASLLQAGVAGVVASLWSVNELSTVLLMVRFYDYWREEQLDPVEALRQAQIWVRDTTNKEKVDYFARKYTDYLSRANPKAADAAIQLKAKIAYHHFQAGNRDFEHPYHWVAFGFTGV